MTAWYRDYGPHGVWAGHCGGAQLKQPYLRYRAQELGEGGLASPAGVMIGMDGALALYFHRDDQLLARAIYDVMYPYLPDTAPDRANFTDFGLDRFAPGVLLKSDMPAATMEPLFMSSPAEAELLRTTIHVVDENGVVVLDSSGNPR